MPFATYARDNAALAKHRVLLFKQTIDNIIIYMYIVELHIYYIIVLKIAYPAAPEPSL